MSESSAGRRPLQRLKAEGRTVMWVWVWAVLPVLFAVVLTVAAMMGWGA